MHSNSLTEWVPILPDGTRDRVLRSVQEVAGTIRSQFPPTQVDATLGSGAAGLALLFDQLAQVLDLERYAEDAQGYRDAARNALSAQALEAGLVDGFVGICAVEAYLDGHARRDTHDEIEAAITEGLESVARRVGLELSRGLLGCGVYALLRMPSDKARRCISGVIDILEREAVHEGEFCHWMQRPPAICADWRREYPDGYVHFGLTHGMAGIVAFLAACASIGADDRAGRLLERAVPWLLAQRREAPCEFQFPALVAADRRTTPGWIYVDLAVASSVQLASEALQRPSWSQAALEIVASLPRSGRAVDRIENHALCHGAAGVAHMLHRLAQSTKSEMAIERAHWWLEHCLTMRRAGHGIAGFLAATDPLRHGGSHAHRPGNPGFLLGAAGTALVLLGFVGDVAPAWDRLLLLSLPER